LRKAKNSGLMFEWQERFSLCGVFNEDLVAGLSEEGVWRLVIFPGDMLDVETEPFQQHSPPGEFPSLILDPIKASEGGVVCAEGEVVVFQ
jgi:hypothetical protein